MLGLVILGISFMIRGNLVMAVVAMTMAVNFKITAVYYLLPFGVYALTQVIKKSNSQNTGTMILFMVLRITLLIFVFIAVNLIIWWPWIFERDSTSGNLRINYEPALQVIARIFPVKRGIFEGKVANFWCVLHNTTRLKVNNWSSRENQFRMTMGTTILGCLPSCWLLYWTPTTKQFLYALFSNSMSFFLFGFQVHEKQIMQPDLIFGLMIKDTLPLLPTF